MTAQRNQEFRKVKDAAMAQGWVIDMTKKSHWRFRAPDGATTVIFGGTPSDHRAIKNFVAQMRRGGLRMSKG